MEKMKMHSPNLTQNNIARIRELFPGCVTEAKGENDRLKLAVDFDQLRQELSESIVEGPQERYHLNWPGKREALLIANAPIAKTLRPCREESSNSHFVPKRALLNGIEGFIGSIGGCVTHSCSAFSARRSLASCFLGPSGSFRSQ